MLHIVDFISDFVKKDGVMKTVAEYKEILSQFKKEFGPQFGIKELGIFGSVARGEQTENSDLDLFVSLEKVEPFIIYR